MASAADYRSMARTVAVPVQDRRFSEVGGATGGAQESGWLPLSFALQGLLLRTIYSTYPAPLLTCFVRPTDLTLSCGEAPRACGQSGAPLAATND